VVEELMLDIRMVFVLIFALPLLLSFVTFVYSWKEGGRPSVGMAAAFISTFCAAVAVVYELCATVF